MTGADIILSAKAAGLRVAVAESSAGGLIAAALTAPPGASAVFDRGIIAYSNSAKKVMLGVQPATLEAVGAVSEEVALEMAQGLLQRADADIALAETGITGPGGSDHKPEGRCCFAMVQIGEDPVVMTLDFGEIGRDGVRTAICVHALDLLGSAVVERPR